ncbi:MAG: TIGR02281 family clan AA aspartic protease [Gammaproteobacteria bacterium]|nr:TIGR02281 family clan AA aspartic protease [Gammaproteobacteria bacterium]
MSQEYPYKIGRGMILFAWILLLLLLTVVFSDFLEHQDNPNQRVEGIKSNGVRSIELRRNRQGHYVATARINGKPVTVLLDTGATEVSVPAPVAADLGLDKGFANQVMTANGVITVYSTLLDKVEIGNIVLHDVRAHINPNMHNREILLGMSFLKQLEFSQQGDTLTITQSGT